MDRQKVVSFTDECEAALDEIAKRYGFRSLPYEVSYSESQCNLKIDFESVEQEDQRATFDRVCWQYGLPKEAYGLTVRVGGKPYIFTGFDFKKRKFPCRCVSDEGKVIMTTVDSIRRFIPASKEA